MNFGYAVSHVPPVYGALSVGLMKIFEWQIIHRFSIKRDLKRLELRVAALSQMLESR